ncbi:MAG: hypothetical protein M1832_002003 [Thelocarpon impressellum]|nr:MAG: hypothetical protein M1832_002003 [Thelocarpon impressellum]
MLRSLVFLALAGRALCLTPLPLIIWHGLGDNFDADGLKSVGELAEQTVPGTFVYNVRLSDDPSADRTATFFGNLTSQLADVCAALAAHPILSTAPAVNALGFSQGGQLLRGYVERCNAPRVRSLVTFGSQHNGIARFQKCGATDWLCQGAIGLLRGNTWSDFVQGGLVPAQYFRDADELPQYLEHSNFLADINNERPVKNATYKANLARLAHFALFLFRDDETVIPKQTAWFDDVNMTSGAVTPLVERPLYTEDWLGLKTLNESGRLHLRETEGGHMQLTDELLTDVFRTYFAPAEEEGEQLEL